jgi:hypothetical protein
MDFVQCFFCACSGFKYVLILDSFYLSRVGCWVSLIDSCWLFVGLRTFAEPNGVLGSGGAFPALVLSLTLVPGLFRVWVPHWVLWLIDQG